MCSTRASKPAGTSAGAAPARSPAAARSVTALDIVLRAPEPRRDRHADGPGPDEPEADGAVRQRARLVDDRDAPLVRQVLPVDLHRPAAEEGARAQVQRRVAVELPDAAVGRPVAEVGRAVSGVAQATADIRAGAA